MMTLDDQRAQLRVRLEQLQQRAHESGLISDPEPLRDIIARLPTFQPETLDAVDAMLDGRPAFPWQWWNRSRD